MMGQFTAEKYRHLIFVENQGDTYVEKKWMGGLLKVEIFGSDKLVYCPQSPHWMKCRQFFLYENTHFIDFYLYLRNINSVFAN